MKKIICILAVAAGLVILGFALYVAGVGFLIYIGVIHPFGKPSIDNMDDPEFRQIVQQQIQVVFPETVQWQKSYHSPWLDLFFCCKFRIPEEDIEPMIARHKGEWYDNDRSKLPYVSHLDWMNLDQLSNFRVFESISDGYSIHVIVDMDSGDDKNHLTVYLKFCDH